MSLLPLLYYYYLKKTEKNYISKMSPSAPKIGNKCHLFYNYNNNNNNLKMVKNITSNL